VKLLFDQNLSHRLVTTLADDFPGAGHVRDFDLQRADDATIWEFAKKQWIHDRFEGQRLPSAEFSLPQRCKKLRR